MHPSPLFVFTLAVAAPPWACTTDPASDADATGAADGADTDDATEPDCPDPTAQIVAAVSGPDDKIPCDVEDLGRVCRYTAPGCEPGAKPDLTCTCREGASSPTWDCARPLTNCFPLGDFGLRDGTRRTPPHRPTADRCDDPADAPRDEACSSEVPSEDACSTHGDCGADEVCRPTQTVSGAPCACQGADCVEDADCPGSAVCHCAPPPTSPGACLCTSHCGHACLPAGCRVDADCGDGALCVGSREVISGSAGSLIARYACNHLATSVCVSDQECETGAVCAWDGASWGCFGRVICL